ncbi:MAG: hypothetical protein HYY84_18945 [Deltaproteobacteria bacterium]|nr:hypothetical protein [Deltaproteobacteria bacterium]
MNALAAKSDDREVTKFSPQWRETQWAERAAKMGRATERSPSPTESRDLRDRAATYARYGVDTIRAAAGFIFRADEAALDRYPAIFVARGRRRRIAPKTAPTTVVPATPAPVAPATPR